MNRRAFLSLLGRGAAVTAAGLVLPYEPQRVYSFLTNNPLALEPREVLVYRSLPLPLGPLTEGGTPHSSSLFTASRVTAYVDQWENWYGFDKKPAAKSPWWRRQGLPLSAIELRETLSLTPSRYTRTGGSVPFD